MAADTSEVVSYLSSAATITYLQRLLKTQPVYQRFVDAFPGADKWAHWTFAGLASLVAALGIHAVWNWDAFAGGSVTFSLPSAVALLHGVGDWWKVYILQHTVHGATTVDIDDIVRRIANIVAAILSQKKEQ